MPKNIFRKIVFLSILLSALPRGLSPSEAQETTSLSAGDRESAYLQEENRGAALEQTKEIRISVEEKEAPPEDLVLKQGGWIGSTYRRYKNIDNRDSEEDFLKWSWRQDAYYWLYLNYQRTHTVYAQIADTYIDRGVGPSYTGIGADSEGPLLSVAYAKIDLSKKYRVPLNLTAGRQHLFVGRGVAYSAIHDGLSMEVAPENVNVLVKGLLSKTKPREDNLDYSVPGFDKEGDRSFAGVEMAYLGIPNLSLYGFGLNQNDLSSPHPGSGTQNYHYDSYYAGVGMSLRPSPGFDIWSEWIVERGSGFTDASRTQLGKSKIRSLGSVSGAKVRFDVPTHPIFETSFAYGSGDGDRTRVTNTTGGDLDGTDKNFLYFGYYQAGYAFQPRLSNIQILQVGASLKPLEEIKPFENLAIGTKYYFYWKDKAQGGTSDSESTGNDPFLGEELNLFLHWKVLDNLTFSTRYGLFFPGESFSDENRDNTEYFFNSLTVSF